jgi:hypothetical protein
MDDTQIMLNLDEKSNRGTKRIFTPNSGTAYDTNKNSITKFKNV